MSPRIKHVWQRLPACYSVKHIARGKPSYIISNSTSQYQKCVIVNGNLTVAVSFIWKISWESMELVAILGMVNFLTFLCAIITTAYYKTERQMIRGTSMEKSFDWLLCSRIPVHASVVVFVAPAIAISTTAYKRRTIT